jgi:hypothetical protein
MSESTIEINDIAEETENEEQKNDVKALLTSGVRFKEHYVHLNDMLARPTDKYDKSRTAGSAKNLLNTAIEFDGKSFFPSQRFWNSFCSKVGVGTNIFNLFSQEEVFNRVVTENKFSVSGNVRIIEDVKEKRLLAITNPTKPMIDWQALLSLIDRKEGYDVRYDDGIITSMHSIGQDLPVRIGAEDHNQRIAVQVPIDGYGSPSVFLALMRLVCENGMVAMSKAFKTSINVGKKDKSDDIEFSLERMFDSYSNDEGFDALIRRLDAARHSFLSVREFEQASRFLSRITPPRNDKKAQLLISEEHRKFNTMAGSLNAKYGLSHLQQMSDKQMSLLETNMTVYEAINYLSEVTTHRLNAQNSRHTDIATSINGWIGSTISRPFDLEGTIDPNNARHEFQERYF